MSLKARIRLLEAEKEQLAATEKLRKEDYFIAAYFAREGGVTCAYISVNKSNFKNITYEGQVYIKKI